ncbi:MAG: DUF6600 domain-containing protein [Methanococcaceae archaeon]
MKYTGKLYITGFIILLLAGSCIARRPEYSGRSYSRGQDYVTAQVFYDELSPYGHWVNNRQYDYVWIPNAGRNFYPYLTDGHWIMTDYGWTWVSDYPWGWAAFHYGRWDYDPYYGWAPMRPGMNVGFSENSDPDRWVFVRQNDFGRSNPERYYISRRNNMQIIRNTTIINNYYTDNQRRVRYPSGPDPDELQRSTGRKISRYAVRDNNRPGTRLNNRELQIYRPRIERSTASGRQPTPPRVTDMDKIRPERQRSGSIRQNREQNTESRPVMQGRRENQRELDLDKVDRRRRDIQKQNQSGQQMPQSRQKQIQMEQTQQADTGRNDMQSQRHQRQQQVRRQQQTEQQKGQMQQQRENNRNDTIVVRSRRKSTDNQYGTKSKDIQVKSRRRVQSDKK